MKYIKSYMFFIWMALIVTSCAYDNLKDDVDALGERVTNMEKQVKILNDNIAVVSYIVDPQNKTITNVQTTGSGKDARYIITLSNGEELILTMGQSGTTNNPDITVGEDGYWYINGKSTGVKAVGEDGKNGDGYPEFCVEDGKWKVRFGTDGTWKEVSGGNLEGIGSVGDQVFESAEVDGDKFVVTLKNSDVVYTLPIVADLICAIDKGALTLSADGYLMLDNDMRTTVGVKIAGENTQITYPKGWRATLVENETTDANGNTHTLFIYAPAVGGANTRATVNNMEDVTVSVQKGIFWAMDKIRVKIGAAVEPEPELTGNLKAFEEGESLTVGGFTFSKETLGGIKATEIKDATAEIKASGVYIVSAYKAVLTYTGTENIENLIIIPNTDEVSSIELNVVNQVKLTKNIVCKNVSVKGEECLAKAEAEGLNIIFEDCNIDNVGLIEKSGTAASVATFSLTNSDVKVRKEGISLINNIDKVDHLTVNNTLVYHTNEGDALAFKILNAESQYLIEKLELEQNTFVDVLPCSSKSFGSFIHGTEKSNVAGKIVKSATVASNLISAGFKSVPIYLMASLGGQYTGANDGVQLFMENNQWYCASGNDVFKILYRGGNSLANNTPKMCSADIFDRTNSETFNKETGIFKPLDTYKESGAQRD